MGKCTPTPSFCYGRIKSVYDFSNLSFKFNLVITGRFNDVIQGHYQKHLLSLIFDLKDRGLNTGEISRKLTEMGYLSVRGKPLLSKHVWSMIKKNRVRLERSKEFHTEIRNFRWVYNDLIK